MAQRIHGEGVRVEMSDDSDKYNAISVEDSSRRNFNHPARISPIKIALVYITISSFWILISDRIAAALFSDAAVLTIVQTVKGWFFVLISGIVIYYLVKSDIKHLLSAYTRLKKADAKSQQYSKELERKVNERTNELVKANMQLQERFDEMEKLHKMTINREIKMIELKNRIIALESSRKKK